MLGQIRVPFFFQGCINYSPIDRGAPTEKTRDVVAEVWTLFRWLFLPLLLYGFGTKWLRILYLLLCVSFQAHFPDPICHDSEELCRSTDIRVSCFQRYFAYSAHQILGRKLCTHIPNEWIKPELISHAKNRITFSNAFHSYPGVQASFSRVLQSNSQLFC